MASLANHKSNTYTKLLLLGDAKTGKTSSLVSLVKAGYKLRILDLDNLLDTLKYLILDQCPELIHNVEYRTIRDKYKASQQGTVLDGMPTAWINALKMFDLWKYTTPGEDPVDLGVPKKWDPDCILVVDSLSRLCDAAYAYHETIIPKSKSTGEYDGRAVYRNAQQDIEKLIALITSEAYTVNLIVIAHGVYQDLPDGTTKIFPQGVGQKLSPKIPGYFPNYIRYKNINGKRSIQLTSDVMIDLANTRPGAIGEKSLSTETGLAEFFAMLRGSAAKK